MLTLPIVIAIVSFAGSAVGWGTVWGKTTQRLKTIEDTHKTDAEKTKELERSIEGIKIERQDLAIAVARLEVKVDSLTKAIEGVRAFLASSQGMKP